VELSPVLVKDPKTEYKALLHAVCAQGTTTRPQLAALSGLPRSSVSNRVKDLVEGGVLVDLGQAESTGGRRAGGIGFPDDAGVVLAVELGSTHARWRLANFAAAPLADGELPIVITWGADEIIGLIETAVSAALGGLGLSIGSIRSCAVGFPAPLNFAEARVTGPPNMAGWDHEPITALIGKWISVPVVVDNDVNIMAWGEYEAKWRQEGIHDLLFIKHGTGIGCGVIADGKLYRGSEGTAGEVGHIPVAGLEETVMCTCGSNNCLEVVGSGKAIVRKLQAQGYQVATASDVSQLVLQGDLVAMNLVRDAGKALGAVMSGIVSFFNPAAIVMGGSLGALEISLLAGMREATYATGTMFSTRHLRIVPSRLGREAGLHGATLLALDLAYDVAIDGLDHRGR